MIKRGCSFLGFITTVFLLAFFIFTQHSASGQIFIDEGQDRGLDAIISTLSVGGSGVSSVDFDQDGDDDLTLGNNGNILFYENVDGQFNLIDPNIDTPSGEIRGVIWTDINNDGNLDLMISAYLGEIRLYKNIGSFEFEDITETSGISYEVAPNWGISFSDVNRDGFVDLQISRYQNWVNPPESPSVQPELWTRLYLNNGDETFTDSTIESDFVIEPAPVFLGVFFDFNNDLWPDNYSIIDRVPGNRLFVNNQ
ncbi:MAG TPA: VCBS repeat-containing protein, partial [Cryomorphaceae bacterium]|nr:VCBS repeat-containing protein [Cryomorphaceae bacterium]